MQQGGGCCNYLSIVPPIIFHRQDDGSVTAIVTNTGPTKSLTLETFSGQWSDGVMSINYLYTYNDVQRRVRETLTFRDNGLVFEQWE